MKFLVLAGSHISFSYSVTLIRIISIHVATSWTLLDRFSDMNFLEQHFYTDAGVNLPTNSLNVTGDGGDNDEGLEGTNDNDKRGTVVYSTPRHVPNHEFADDSFNNTVVEKVNDVTTNRPGRRIGKTTNATRTTSGTDSSDVRFRNTTHQRSMTVSSFSDDDRRSVRTKKRHSSILNPTVSATTVSANNFFSNNNRIVQKRYSLNISSSVAWSRDFDSRIPVCIRKYRTNNPDTADSDDVTTTSEPQTKQHSPLSEITAQMSNLSVATLGQSNDPPQENKISKTSSLPLAIRLVRNTYCGITFLRESILGRLSRLKTNKRTISPVLLDNTFSVDELLTKYEHLVAEVCHLAGNSINLFVSSSLTLNKCLSIQLPFSHHHHQRSEKQIWNCQ